LALQTSYGRVMVLLSQ